VSAGNGHGNGNGVSISRSTKLDDLPELITVEELAKWLDIARGSAYGLVARGAVRSIRIGRPVRSCAPRSRSWLGEHRPRRARRPLSARKHPRCLGLDKRLAVAARALAVDGRVGRARRGGAVVVTKRRPLTPVRRAKGQYARRLRPNLKPTVKMRELDARFRALVAAAATS